MTDVLQLLETERQALLALVERVPAERREVRPAPDSWSVAEVLEHLARVERGIARLIVLRGREQPVNQAAADPLDALRIERLRTRMDPLVAPERVRPSGSMGAADALRALGESRSQLREAVSAADPASLAGCTHPHAVLGVLTLGDWVAFVAHHEARHAAQISRIAEALS